MTGGAPGATGAVVCGSALGDAVGRRVGGRVRRATGDSVACGVAGASSESSLGAAVPSVLAGTDDVPKKSSPVTLSVAEGGWVGSSVELR